MIGRFDLTDWEWSIIEPLLPGRTGKKARGRPRRDDRRWRTGLDENGRWEIKDLAAAKQVVMGE